MTTLKTFNVLKPWTVTEKRSPWFGTHDSGIVNIPSDEFTPEVFKQLEDDGILEFVSEKEIVADAPQSSVPNESSPAV